MFVLVTGPESSGTRWVSRLCARALNIDGHGQWGGVDIIHNDQHGVLHRSLPHGKRANFIDIQKLMSEHVSRFGDVGHIVVCIRDQSCAFQSAKRAHNNDDHDMTRKNMQRAATICRALLHDPTSFLFSYETAMYLRDGYVRLLTDRLGRPALKDINYDDANRKYLLTATKAKPNSTKKTKPATKVKPVTMHRRRRPLSHRP